MKTARGILILSLAMVLCAGAVGTGIAAGRNGNGNGGGAMRGNGDGTRNALDIVSDQDVTIEGTVQSVGVYGQGIGIDTEVEIIRVFGIGPVRYWEDVLETARPDVGDVIKVTGREVTFSDGTTKIIVYTVTFVVTNPEETIVLRDEENGLPLWRGEGFERKNRYTERYCIGNDDSGL